MRLPGYTGPYSENPGIPTDEEWGVYCPHGMKIVEAEPTPTGDRAGVLVSPWPCPRPGCTLERFELEMEAAEREGREPMWPGISLCRTCGDPLKWYPETKTWGHDHGGYGPYHEAKPRGTS